MTGERGPELAGDVSSDDAGYPWLSWGRTGVLTLAGVLLIGLLISVRSPPAERAGKDESASGAKSSASDTVPVAAPPPRRAPAAPAPPSTADSAAPSVAGPAEVKDTSPRAAQGDAWTNDRAAWPEMPAAKSVLPPSSAKVEAAPEAVVAAPAPTPEDPAKHGDFVRAVADVRAALAERNLAAAKRHLETAEANFQGPAEQSELDRLQALDVYLEQFWKGVRAAVAAMQPLDEIVLTESDRVAVIEASREELAIQREGRPQRARIEALPVDILWAIARQSFKPTAEMKLIVGSFLVMDSHGDRATGRRLWEEAIRDGQSQGTLLLPELEVPRAGRGKR